MNYLLSILTNLDRSLKVEGFIFLLLAIIGMLFEMLGIGLFIPIILTVLEPDFLKDYPQIERFLFYDLGIANNQLLLMAVLSLIIFYCLKTIFMTFLAFRSGKFIFSIRKRVSEILYRSYLFSSYTFLLRKNSSDIIRNISSEIGYFTSGLRALIIIFVEGLLLVGIILILILIEPLGISVIAPFLFLTFFLIRFSTKERLLSYGNSRQLFDGKRILHLQHTVGSIKDIKMSSKEDEFLKKFEQFNSPGINAEKKQFIIAQLPKLFLETVIVFCIGFLVLFLLLALDRSPESVSLTLGILAIAIFRMLPSVNRILGSAQQLRYTFPSFKTLSQELNNSVKTHYKYDSANASNLTFEEEISIKDLSYRYTDNEENVLENINLDIQKNSLIGIIGESGTGKTTFVNLLLGLLSPSRGSIHVDQKNITDSLKNWQKKIGYVQQQTFILDASLKVNITMEFSEKDFDIERFNFAIEGSQLGSFFSSLPDGLETNLGEGGSKLSGGQQQRIGIARALYKNASVLVLDESTSNLDAETEKRFMDAVLNMKGKRTIILITHRPTILGSCDHIYKISNKSITSIDNKY